MKLREILKERGIQIKVVADALGVHPNNISRYDDLTKRTIEDVIKISNATQISISNLIGDSIGENQQINMIHMPKSPEKMEDNSDINLYDIGAAANLKTLLINKDQNILGKISVPNIPKCDGAVYVKGDSMYPLLKSGDIIAYKEIPLEMNYIFFGEMYLVSIDQDGDEYLTVKYVDHSDKGGDWIKLISYNSHHKPKDFPLSSVRAMALIKLSIRMNTMR